MVYLIATLLTGIIIMLVIIVRPFFYKYIARKVWDKYHSEADWERYDFVDPPYCWACIISLEACGFQFYGEGQITGGTDYDIEYIDCTCPDGTVVKIV